MVNGGGGHSVARTVSPSRFAATPLASSPGLIHPSPLVPANAGIQGGKGDAVVPAPGQQLLPDLGPRGRGDER